MRKLNGLDLFSGIGGITIALGKWVKPVAYCEIDPYCQSVLLQRMQKKDLPKAPIWDDVRTLSFDKTLVDIIYGGFPCQDISVAGHGIGLDGERSGLYWEIHRLAQEIKPSFLFLENVPAICTKGGWEVVSSLAQIGYDCRWTTLSAAEVGALHKRERFFLLAYANSKRPEEFGNRAQRDQAKFIRPANSSTDVAYSRCKLTRCKEKSERPYTYFARCCRYWEAEPPVGRVANGVPNRVDRIKALGNAVVPLQVREAFKLLIGK